MRALTRRKPLNSYMVWVPLAEWWEHHFQILGTTYEVLDALRKSLQGKKYTKIFVRLLGLLLLLPGDGVIFCGMGTEW